MSGLRVGLVVLPCLLVANVSAGNLSPREVAAVERAVKQEMERQELVGVAVGVLRDGRVVHTAAFGLADSERRRPFQTSTLFNWASNSKPVMAVAAMQLVEAGKLDLDADVRKYVPEFPEHAHTVTTRQLLCHQSGIPHYSNGRIVPLPGARGDGADPVVSLRRFAASPLLFEPRAKTSYSSYAYVLLSAVVQRAGGEPIGDQLRSRIVDRLELRSFTLDTDRVRPNWAVGYRKLAGRVVRSPDVAHAWKHGAGGYKSNIDDFARWAAGLLGGKLVTKETERAMWTLQKTSDGKDGGYALGFAVDGTGDQLRVSHNGSQEETKTRMVLYPRAGHGMVVATNCHHADPGRISTAVYRALAASRTP